MVHDCFVSFWEHYKGREIENPEGLLFTTVRNRCLDSIRKRCPDNTLLERHIRDVSTDLLYAHASCRTQPTIKPSMKNSSRYTTTL